MLGTSDPASISSNVIYLTLPSTEPVSSPEKVLVLKRVNVPNFVMGRAI